MFISIELIGGFKAGHSYLFKLYNFSENNVVFWGSNPIGTKYNSFILNVVNDINGGSLDIITASGKTYNNFTVGVGIFDLTKMFGSNTGIVSALGLSNTSEITANNGSKCIEAFERLFPSSYYAHYGHLIPPQFPHQFRWWRVQFILL